MLNLSGDLSYKRGFTLIELMVVISMIGTLSSIVLAGLNSARVRSYDAKLMTELGSLRTALFMYKNETGNYPPCPLDTVCTDYSGFSGFSNALNILVTSGYISKIPHYQNWPQAVPNRNVYMVYAPSIKAAMTGTAGYPYSSENTCRAADYSSWTPGTYPNGIIAIKSDGQLDFPKVHSQCSDDPSNPGCFVNYDYYCLELQ